ncbi:farnesol dehydrogenase-like [Anopheles nili]|uniref:farnesol dehydrogenase-like n=1 Tax=Anopheles nili TaxID=185578 RepID=UPI00237C27B3|nr:farnesol dehydrogenase-like [Anopheles nili]
MERWIGRLALVTGASSGIGAATAKALTKAGMITVGLVRRTERIYQLKQELPNDVANRLHAMQCDVTKEEDILFSFRQIEDRFGSPYVLINCAGFSRNAIRLLQPNNTQVLRDVIDTNLLGLALCSREAYLSMKKRSIDGHIVHINSIAGHKVPPFNTVNIYPASKYGVTALTETMRHEMRLDDSKVKVTSISPGLVRTEMTPEEALNCKLPMLEPEDIVEGIIFVLGTRPEVQVHEMIIKPLGEKC